MKTATKKPPRQLALYAEAQALGREAAFLANVILTGHANPTRKLAGLIRLVDQGHEVRLAQFSIDVLIIDGRRADWPALETA
jgi:hypothetical protein